jgi:hypothetical protein
MSYRYVGPAEIAIAATTSPGGTVITSTADLAAWLAASSGDREQGGTVATFIITTSGEIRIASRRSEHVACAGGLDVLSAGEIVFVPARAVAVSNLSTGYCPEPASWPAVARALERAGIAHAGGFTNAYEFRRCPGCGERNLVKDDFFACALCDAELPAAWNFA